MQNQKTIRNRNVTSKDVAALAGVSQSTVSRVLSSNNKTNSFIGLETTERVKKVAKELGYSPNPIARALRGQSTNLIGLVVREIADPFFAELIEELSIQIREAGLNVVFGHAHSDPGEALVMTHVLDSRQCDGVIFLGDLRNDENAIKSILTEGHPVVALCRGKSSFSLPTVNVNNEIGIELLIEHLLSLGHRKFIFVDGGWFGDIHERRSIFLRELEDVKGDVQFTWLQANDNSANGGYLAMHEVIKMRPIPTAIMASDDGMATGILKAAFDLGINVPRDVSVTGFDDIDYARYTIPGLTTIRQPMEEMSTLALNLLQRQIDQEKIPERETFNEITPELIVRDSSGPAKK